MTNETGTLIPIGRVVRLQIHLERIAPGASLYDAVTPLDHLMHVDALSCDHRGVCGITADGDLQRDLHHKDHAVSHYRRANDISLMATGHYSQIQERFGEHMVHGIAGENVLIDYEDVLTLDDLAGGMVIGDGERRFSIDAWRIATPCAPFSWVAAGIPPGEKPDQRMTEALKFLSNGMRGFYGTLPAELSIPVTICVGDMVYLRRA
jgi:hypothetical protein